MKNNNYPPITILDGNFNIIKNLTFDVNTTCFQYLTAAQIASMSLAAGSQSVLCNPSPIELVLSADMNNSRYLNIDPSKMSPKYDYYVYLTRNHTIPNYQPMDNSLFSMGSTSDYYF
jgi:hypothetical protein